MNYDGAHIIRRILHSLRSSLVTTITNGCCYRPVFSESRNSHHAMTGFRCGPSSESLVDRELAGRNSRAIDARAKTKRNTLEMTHQVVKHR